MADLEEADGELTATGAAIGRFASDENNFRALVDAFRARDAEAYRSLLMQRDLLDRCELVCRWISCKECVLICLSLCGPAPDVLPDPREFAEVVVSITTDAELVERLANAVDQRRSDLFAGLVAELKIEPFCHLLCQWVCSVRHRLMCGVVYEPVQPLEEELLQAGRALQELLANESVFKQAEETARFHRCEIVAASRSRAACCSTASSAVRGATCGSTAGLADRSSMSGSSFR